MILGISQQMAQLFVVKRLEAAFVTVCN